MNKKNTPLQPQHEIEGEIWIPVPKLEDSFEISSASRVRNKTTKTILSPQIKGSKYVFFMLYNRKSKKRVKKYLHRMVALCFVPNPYKLHEVNHIDGNKLNNSVSNLEFVTPSQNQLHAIRTGLRTNFFKPGDTNGEKNKLSKLTWKYVDELRAWGAEKKRTNKEMKAIATKYGVGFSTIYNVINRKSWNEETRGM